MPCLPTVIIEPEDIYAAVCGIVNGECACFDAGSAAQLRGACCCPDGSGAEQLSACSKQR